MTAAAWKSRAWSNKWGRVGGALVLTMPAVFVMASTNSASADSGAAPAIVTGSAAAYGVRVTYLLNGFPLTNTPFDGGGPTAQAAVDSGLGVSNGFAAFPDPGPVAASGPALVAGVLGGGVPGVLPPITGLPPFPDYPLSVASNALEKPEVSAGADPVSISARSGPTSSEARAVFGTAAPDGSSAAGVLATASVTQVADGSVARAESNSRGLAFGPLTLGQVLTTATATAKADGKVTRATTMELTGVRIGDVPVSLTPKGFNAGGSTSPAELNSTFATILKDAGVTVEFVPEQVFPESGRVVAPGIVISVPMPDTPQIPGVGQFSGRQTYTIGFATAEIAPPSPASPSVGQSGSVPATSGGVESAAAAAPASNGGLDAAVLDGGAGIGTVPGTGVTGPSTVGAADAASGLPGPATASFLPAQQAAGVGTDDLDVSSVYLIGIVAMIMAAAAGPLISRFGVAK